MPKLVAASGSVVSAAPGAHHYRLVGLEIAPEKGVFLRELVQFGSSERDAGALPHHIIIDRCYLHGDPGKGTRRGVAMNSRDTAVVDSYLSDFKEVGADSQAIAGWNGAGPFKIANSYLEAAGENVMFGGADPAIPDMVPADIEVMRNHFAKPLRWKMDDPRFEGTAWTVKNLFELKNARRVLVDGNIFEHNWPHGQNGFAILFTVRNQDGGAPWSVVEGVTFTNNIVRHVGSGINILGRDDNHPSQQTRRITIHNNLFVDLGGRWGQGRLFQLLDGTRDIVIDHNTALQTGGIIFGGDHDPHAGFVFQNNITLHNSQGILGSGTSDGTPTLERYFPGASVQRNVIVGGTPARYPADNYFPRSLDDVGASLNRSDDFRLSVSRKYARTATDGRDPGADMEAIARATRGVVSPRDQDSGTTFNVEATHPPTPRRVASRPDKQSWLVGPPSSGSTRRDFAGAQSAKAGVWPLPGGERWHAETVVFWGALFLLGYIYLGYPLVARLRAVLRPKMRRRAPIEPTVTVVVAVYNEGGRIADRIENLLSLDYPHDRLEIIVGSDGSTDDTVEKAGRYADVGVKVRAFRQRRGKPAVLNALVPAARGEIVVFADARQRFDPGALRALVANFADPSAGAVSGELNLSTGRTAAAAAHGTAFYWRYEKFIRSTEGRADSTIGATGAIYAIRRDLFEPIPEDTILDDVLIPLQIVRRGYRVLFEPDARAYDRAPSTAREEFVRKARTIAGTFQLFARAWWLLHPLRNRLWFETISHKALRLTIPALHVALFAANVALLDVPPYTWLLAGQVVFFAAALAGCTQRDARRRLMICSVPYTICLLAAATVVGFVRFATQRQQVTWERLPPTRQVPQPHSQTIRG
jgi:cellulose synthase/poly-beta-1,6-N-acetylglucosamine synthase-like glycosyltransferase